jgi:dipeptidyl aminopeptidase/acylaminoacyl peptidase
MPNEVNMKRLPATVAFVIVILLVSVSAQTKRPMTFEDVIALKNVSDAQISPDGRWITYVVTRLDLKENISDSDVWMVSADGGKPIRMTTSPKSDTQPRWSPDGKQIAFISSRAEKPQLFLISPFGGEPEKLTESKTGVQTFQWSPDGSRLAFVAERTPTEEEEKKIKDKDDAQVVDRDFKYSVVWVIDLSSKKATELVKTDYVVTDPQWSPDGKSIAYTVTPTPRADDGNLTDIWVVDVDTHKQRKLIDNEGSDYAPRWSPDGRFIGFLSHEGKTGPIGHSKITLIAADGSGAKRVLAPLFEYQPGPATWSADGKNIYFNSSVRTTGQLFSVPTAGGEAKQISNVSGLMAQATFSRDRWVSAFVKSDIQNPPEIHVARSLSLINPVRLTDHNSQVKELSLGTHEVVRWTSKDGMEIEGVVLYPVGFQRGKAYPTVAVIHGGPSGVWTEAFPSYWGNFGHVWAGKGWVVFYPNCRGSSAYGEKFLLSNIRDWGGGDYQDIQTGIDNLIAKGVADPVRLGQTGWSYGGYMTAWTLTQTDRFKAVMVGAGLTNMYSMYSTNDLQRVLEVYFGAQPWDDTEIYWRKSAMAFIKKAKTPTLILHGAEDKRVPVGQAQELYMGLRKNSVPVELVFYPREPHGLREPRHQIDKMRREYAWFSKHVLGVEVADPKPAKDDKKPIERPSGDR